MLAALGDRGLAAELEPARRAAAGWLKEALDRGGGYVRHGAGAPPGSLTQQGWRDAIDPSAKAAYGGSIARPDGSAPKPPLADADTQAVAYAALRALTTLSGEDRWWQRAEELAQRIEADFGQRSSRSKATARPVPGPELSSVRCCGLARSAASSPTRWPSGSCNPTC